MNSGPIAQSILESLAPLDKVDGVPISREFSQVLVKVDQGAFDGNRKALDDFLKSSNPTAVALSDEQKDIILREFSLRETLLRASASSEGFQSFLEEIATGRYEKKPDELRARFADRSDGYIVLPNGRAIYDESGFAVERRRLLPAAKEELLKINDLYIEIEERAQFLESKATREASELAAAGSLLRELNSGRYDGNVDELLARLQERQDGYVVLPSGRALSSPTVGLIVEQRKTSSQQKDVIRGELSERVTWMEKLKELRRPDFQSFIQDSIDGRFVDDGGELRARLRARGGYAVADDGRAFQLPRNAGQFVEENRVLSPDQKESIRILNEWFNNPNFGEIIRRAFADSLNAIDATPINTALLEIRRNAISAADVVFINEQEEKIRIFGGILCREALETRFYELLLSPNQSDVSLSLSVVARFPQFTLEDRELARSLTDVYANRVRVEKLARAYSTAAEDFTQGVAEANSIFTSRGAVDNVRAVTVVDEIYQAELDRKMANVLSLITDRRVTAEEFESVLDSGPSRPQVGQINYFQAAQNNRVVATDLFQRYRGSLKLGDEARDLKRVLDAVESEKAMAAIQAYFDRDMDPILVDALIGRYRQFVTARRQDREEEYRSLFAVEIEERNRQVAPTYEFLQGLESNLSAVRYLAGQFGRVMVPAYQSYLGHEATASVASYVSTAEAAQSERFRYVIKVKELEKQRPLTDIEADYFRSVEFLSGMNPHLVAMANVDAGILNVYLQNHFATLSAQTRTQLKDGDYLPIVQLGLGPNGLTAAGELVRTRPDIAQNTLFVDVGELPGGPFAVPRGPAWDLNSANSYGDARPTLPALPLMDERKTVRAYGSSLRWYPGERLPGGTSRPGSINTSVDYLLTADNISTARYPTNADEALVLQLQAAMLVKKMLLSTRVERLQPAPLDGKPGDKLITLVRTDSSNGDVDRVTLRCDNFLAFSGLGDPNYGFPLEGSRAEKVIKASAEWNRFSPLEDTLGAFRALTSRDDTRRNPGRVVAIYGGGNSADTLVEYLGALFASDNPIVRGIEKIYVITDKEPSKRPRYASITDLRARNGRGNIVELVNARVRDVDFKDGEPDQSSKLVLFETNTEGKLEEIRDNSGALIEADTVIASTGFRSDLDRILIEYMTAKAEQLDSGLIDLVLPTNPQVTVAQQLKADPGVLVGGVASRSGFDYEKLAQLPLEAREALLRNGAENAVAIGFRAPDTQAAIRLFLEERFSSLDRQTIPPPQRVWSIELTRSEIENVYLDPIEPIPFQLEERSVLPKIRDNVQPDSPILSPLLFYSLGEVRFVDGMGNLDTSCDFQLPFTVMIDEKTKLGRVVGNPASLAEAVKEVCANPYFQAYAREAVRKRKGSTSLAVNLKFTGGKLDRTKSFAQAL